MVAIPFITPEDIKAAWETFAGTNMEAYMEDMTPVVNIAEIMTFNTNKRFGTVFKVIPLK